MEAVNFSGVWPTATICIIPFFHKKVKILVSKESLYFIPFKIYSWDMLCFYGINNKFVLKTQHILWLPLGGGTPNFHFGIGKQPEGLNRRACEWITVEFGTLVNWIS